MSVPTTNLLDLVRDKQTQIAKLQAELDEVRQLLVNGNSAALATPAKGRGRPKKNSRFVAAIGMLPGIDISHARGGKRRKRRQSSVTLAASVVQENGVPMHVDEMIKRIAAKHGQQVDKQTLVSNLSRLVKAGEMFERTGPNTFGLKEGK